MTEMSELANALEKQSRLSILGSDTKILLAEAAVALRSSASAEPVAWQWRYVGEQDHEWKTPSGGRKIANEDRPLQHPIEQRPLYANLVPAAPTAAPASVREAVPDRAQGVTPARTPLPR